MFKWLSKPNKLLRFERDLLLSEVQEAVYGNNGFAAQEDATWSLPVTSHTQQAPSKVPRGTQIPNTLKPSNARSDPLPLLLGDDHSRGGCNPGRSPGWRVRGAAKTTHCSTTTDLAYRCICVSIHHEWNYNPWHYLQASIPTSSTCTFTVAHFKKLKPTIINTLNTFADQESTCFQACTCMYQACTGKHLRGKETIS